MLLKTTRTFSGVFLIGFYGLCALAVALVGAFEENDKFCIRTEPMLLYDIEKHENPALTDPQCEVLATTLTVKEKESFLNTMCKDYANTKRGDEYHFFKLRNGDLTGRGSHTHICDGKSNPLLAWIPYEMILHNYAQELNPKERVNYIAKATSVQRQKTDLCHFRHSDLVTNIAPNLFTCIVMIFEDNFYDLDSNINVLVEIQPAMFEIRNVTYLPWVNVTTSYKTMLGNTTLKNPSRDQKQIYGSVPYAYVEKVKINASTVYGYDLEKLPLLFEHKESVLELDSDGVGGIDVKTKAYFGRAMDPKTSVKVDVIGQWAEHRKQFNADIYDYFGYGIRRFRREMLHGDVILTRIESTEPVFEEPESTNLASVTIFTNEPKPRSKFARLTESTSNETKRRAEWGHDDDDEESTSGHPYPNFYAWFIAGCVIVGAVILLAVIGLVRACSQPEDPNTYKFAKV